MNPIELLEHILDRLGTEPLQDDELAYLIRACLAENRQTIAPQRIADEILQGAHRMVVDLKSTLDISDEVFEALTKLAARN